MHPSTDHHLHSSHLLTSELEWQKIIELILIKINAHPNTQTIFLQGTLGVGKTTFMRHFLKHLGYTKAVKSPTYAVLASYSMDEIHACKRLNLTTDLNIDLSAQNTLTLPAHIKHIHHFDAYRIQSIEQWHDYHFDACFSEPALNFIEWPENCAAAVAADIILVIDYAQDFEDLENQVNDLGADINTDNVIFSQNRRVDVYVKF